MRRAVIANTSAPQLYRRLLPPDVLPDGPRRDLDRFVWDTPVLKIDYALDAPIPWRSRSLAGAGTVHLGADHDGLVRWMADLNTGTVPSAPFMLFGQMTTADPSRSPDGTESAWRIRTCRASAATTARPINWPRPSTQCWNGTPRASPAMWSAR